MMDDGFSFFGNHYQLPGVVDKFDGAPGNAYFRKIMEFTDWIEYECEGKIEGDYDYYLARQEWESIYRPNLFFVGLNPRWQMYKFLPPGINVMFSAAGFFDGEKREWRRGAKFKWSFGFRWLDCGGFTMMNKFNDYPFSVVNYANLVARLRPHFYATMDYPCEPEISRSLGLLSNEQRIAATVANAVELAEWESQLPGQMVPVIQGYTIDEYLECLCQYQEAGMVRDYMAVGSMCRRISNEELGNLIPALYYAAQKVGCTKLHYFGLKLSPAVQRYADMIWSRDSAAILDDYDKSLRADREGRRWPKGQQEKKIVFNAFLGRLEELGLNYKRV
jgi:hypothetical protein